MTLAPTDRRDYSDLREYIERTLGVEIARLTIAFDKQATVLHDIELKTTIRTAELQKDIDGLKSDIIENEKEIDNIKRQMDQENSTRQFTSNENRTMISNLRMEQMTKWEMQISINETVKGLKSVVWAIFIMVLGILGSAVYQMLVGGGAGALK